MKEVYKSRKVAVHLIPQQCASSSSENREREQDIAYVKSLHLNLALLGCSLEDVKINYKWVNFSLIDIQYLRAAVLIEDILENILAIKHCEDWHSSRYAKRHKQLHRIPPALVQYP